MRTNVTGVVRGADINLWKPVKVPCLRPAGNGK